MNYPNFIMGMYALHILKKKDKCKLLFIFWSEMWKSAQIASLRAFGRSAPPPPRLRIEWIWSAEFPTGCLSVVTDKSVHPYKNKKTDVMSLRSHSGKWFTNLAEKSLLNARSDILNQKRIEISLEISCLSDEPFQDLHAFRLEKVRQRTTRWLIYGHLGGSYDNLPWWPL